MLDEVERDNKAVSRYYLNDPMRLIIAFVLGTLTFQGAPFELGLRRYDANSPQNDEVAALSPFYRPRKKRSSHNQQRRAAPNTQRYTNRRNVLLFSKSNHYFLQVSKDGKVNGTADRSSANILFTIEIYTGMGKARILNKAHKRYVAINRRGRIFSQENKTEESLFYYHAADGHDRFSSAIYPSRLANKRDQWLLTIKKNGKIKNAKNTDLKMKATHFLLIDWS